MVSTKFIASLTETALTVAVILLAGEGGLGLCLSPAWGLSVILITVESPVGG